MPQVLKIFIICHYLSIQKSKNDKIMRNVKRKQEYSSIFMNYHYKLSTEDKKHLVNEKKISF